MRNRLRFRWLVALVCLVICLEASIPMSSGAQYDAVSELMALMSPSDKIGQLFIVTFRGSDTGRRSDIAQLVHEYRVGAVALSASQENFSSDYNSAAQILRLTRELQSLSVQDDASPLSARFGAGDSQFFAPLFVAMQIAGDAYPNTDILSGLTSLPSLMALGATWKPNNAFVAGEIAGRELSALGINMVFGPSLDVQNNPRLGLKGSIGTYSFGGDPYWVGEMGESYIGGFTQARRGILSRSRSIFRVSERQTGGQMKKFQLSPSL